MRDRPIREGAMARILSFSSGPNDWQRQLADPEKHWKTGYSARTLAYCWEDADGFPAEVAASLSCSCEPLLEELTPLLAVPEFKVPLPGGERASQNDIFVLARSSAGAVSIMVEGKVRESFGPTLESWCNESSSGKAERLRHILRVIGLVAAPQGDIRYQLLHRAASAVITAEQYRAVAAIVLIHSFSPERSGWPDFQAFTRLFGVEAEHGCVQKLAVSSRVPLFGAWITGNPKYLTC